MSKISGVSDRAFQALRSFCKSVIVGVGFTLLACNTRAENPFQLILDKESSDSTVSNRIHYITFDSDGSLTVLGSQGNRLEKWELASRSKTRGVAVAYTDVKSACWIGGAGAAVVTSPMQIAVWDLEQARLVNETKTQDVDGWPLACSPSGLCAWETMEGSDAFIVVQNLVTPGSPLRLKVGPDRCLALDITPDGKFLAAAVNRPEIRLWALDKGEELPALELRCDHPGGLSPHMVELGQYFQKLIVFQSGMATTVKFSPDGKMLAAGNDVAIHLWRMDSRTDPILLKGYEIGVTCLAFSFDGAHLYAAGLDHTIRQWRTDTAALPAIIGKPSGAVRNIYVRDDDGILATASDGGIIHVWKVSERRLLAQILILAKENGWIVITPEGTFDTSEEAWHHASWRFADSDTEDEPIERYFRDFYQAGLLSEVLAGLPASTRRRLQDVSRAVPEVSLEVLDETKKTVPVKAKGTGAVRLLETKNFVRFAVHAKPTDNKGKVVDLCVTHNGIVFKKWQGDLPLTNGVVSEEFEIAVDAAGSKVTAYAYNQDSVRSQEAVWERPRQGWGVFVRPSTLYVIVVGINQYDNKAWRLKFAKGDADLVAESLTISDDELFKMGRRASDWAFQEMLQRHIQSQTLEQMPATIQITKIVDSEGTRARIIEALQKVASDAESQDSMLFIFSGHGLATDDHFYLVPSDAKLPDDKSQFKAADIEATASSLISDDDLANALESLFVAHCAIIIDACRSGQLLSGSEYLGPLRSGGLTRLAYEKGICLLTSTQANELVAEPDALQHGLLIYSLFEEGLKERKADFRPRDGRIELNEWLSYGAQAVADISRRIALKATENVVSEDSVQRAGFVSRLIPESSKLLLLVSEDKPGE